MEGYGNKECCGNCKHYDPDDTEYKRFCPELGGYVAPNWWCNLFERKSKDDR